MVALSGNSDTSTALEDQSSSRSFFSRFALPIRSRSTRNLVDFHVRPAEPHRKYNAGDPVKGAVVLAVVKPIRVTHLTVALRGFVRVYKSPNAASEPFVTPEIDSDGVSQFRFLGNGYASLFQDEQVLCADGRLEAGKYEFNFELIFPEHGLPSSIEVSLRFFVFRFYESSHDATLVSYRCLLLTQNTVRARNDILHDYCNLDQTDFNITDVKLRTQGRICGTDRCWATPSPPTTNHISRADIQKSKEKEVPSFCRL